MLALPHDWSYKSNLFKQCSSLLCPWLDSLFCTHPLAYRVLNTPSLSKGNSFYVSGHARSYIRSIWVTSSQIGRLCKITFYELKPDVNGWCFWVSLTAVVLVCPIESNAITMNAYNVVNFTYKWEMIVGREKVHWENVKKEALRKVSEFIVASKLNSTFVRFNLPSPYKGKRYRYEITTWRMC